MTIDHMVSLALLVMVLFASISAYSQIIATAVRYQQNHEISMKASELANTLLLSPGAPADWALSNSTPSAFGLQDHIAGGYSLNAFSMQRLSSATQTPVYYYKTGLWYSNNSLGGGGSLLVPLTTVVNYTTATKLLGVNGSYAFRLTVSPTLNVSISEIDLAPLRLRIDVKGPGLSLRGARLNCLLFRAIPQGGQYPSFQAFFDTSQTDTSGSATLEFGSVDGSEFAYFAIVYARLGGLAGVGYRSRITSGNNKIIPFVEDPRNKTVILAHSWDVHEFSPPVAALHFNATFFSLTDDFELREIKPIEGSGSVTYGKVNYGEGYPYARVQIPIQGPGILAIAYRKSVNELGIAMMPWGISPLGFSITYGGNPESADWVATELRQVVVGKISYQVTLAVWSTRSYRPWGYHP